MEILLVIDQLQKYGRGILSTDLREEFSLHSTSLMEIYNHGYRDGREGALKIHDILSSRDGKKEIWSAVPDIILNNLVIDYISKSVENREEDYLVIDGYPITESQAKILDEGLEERGLEIKEVIHNFVVLEDEEFDPHYTAINYYDEMIESSKGNLDDVLSQLEARGLK